MPLYDCKCPACGKVKEQLLKREEPPAKCDCGTPMEREVAQLTSFALKGGGWYRDGYSKGSGAK